ncbi:cold shock domain-containing protein [Acinetobacter variabilis]|uniref:cold shock domain-containing protein n=1 Tax=Acinetobacter variabilis TaxID=70346 RepID=UPI00289ED513|nr:cold shock domain-containing protein [Acinetobacter variabilis]
MFLEGKIKTYNEERGFGFIEIAGESKDLFFHIKDFPNKNMPPKVGESLKFLIVEDQGKFKADNIVRLDVKINQPNQKFNERKVPTGNRSKRKTDRQGFDFLGLIFTVVIVGVFIIIFVPMIYGKFQRAHLANQPTTATGKTNGIYTCDGRTTCTSMTSRDEARWFIRNCPGTKMDGNNDGEPCENDSRW